MKVGTTRTLQYKGYDIFVMEDGDINIYRNESFVIHASCKVTNDEEEILQMVDDMLSFHETIKRGNVRFY